MDILFFVQVNQGGSNGSNTTCYSIDYCPYSDVKGGTITDINGNPIGTSINSQFYLGVAISNTTYYKTYNLNTIWTEIRDALLASDWTMLAKVLDTVDMVPYEASVAVPLTMLTRIGNDLMEVQLNYNRPTVSAGTKDFTSDLAFTVDYTSIDHPSDVNIENIRWMLPDLAIHKVSRTDTTDFSKIVPIVNGIAHYPLLYTDASETYLFAVNGAKSLKNLQGRTATVYGLDFSNLGDIEILRCKDVFIQQVPDTSTDLSIQVTLPHALGEVDDQGVLTSTHTLLFFLAGRLVYHTTTLDEPGIHLLSDKTFKLDMLSSHFNAIMASNAHIRKDYLYNVSNATLPTPTEYIGRMTGVTVANTNNDRFNGFYTCSNPDAQSKNRVYTYTNQQLQYQIRYNTITNRWNILVDSTIYFYGEDTTDPWEGIWRTNTNVTTSTAPMITKDDDYDSFIVIIKRSDVKFIRSNSWMELDRDKIKFDLNADGLLLRGTTDEIIPYTRIKFDGENLLGYNRVVEDITERNTICTVAPDTTFATIPVDIEYAQVDGTQDIYKQVEDGVWQKVDYYDVYKDLFCWVIDATDDPAVSGDSRILYGWDVNRKGWVRTGSDDKHSLITIVPEYLAEFPLLNQSITSVTIAHSNNTLPLTETLYPLTTPDTYYMLNITTDEATE